MGGAFAARFLAPGTTVYLPDKTWGNHAAIFKDCGFKIGTYPYYDSKGIRLNFDAMLKALKALPNGSFVLFHACAHNPTGVDPSFAQWQQIVQACREKSFLVFMDMAYQGFASGDAERDAQALRLFLDKGASAGSEISGLILAQSFAKNMGLYGERVGALSILGSNASEKAAIDSQVKILARAMYSNPPLHGARIVAKVLGDAQLKALWQQEVKLMADRIINVRKMLRERLENGAKSGSGRDWSHVTNQIGMFCYSGLKPEQVDKLAQEHHGKCHLFRVGLG